MMAMYKFCYFDTTGVGEMSRMLFAEADVEFEDYRISQEDWESHKPKMPFGKIPVLFVDGEPIANSRAIVRYLARVFGFDGGNPLTAAKVDVWIETLFESLKDVPLYEHDEAKRAEKFAAIVKDPLGPLLEKVEIQIKSTRGEYVFGEDITAFDVVLFSMMENLEGYFSFKLDNYTTLTKCLKAIAERPKIAAWLKARSLRAKSGHNSRGEQDLSAGDQ